MRLTDHIALVAGATRGAGRGIATELGAEGATVYVTGRSTRRQRSSMGRSETIEGTAELVDAAGGHGIAVRCDHSDPQQVSALIERIGNEQSGRLDLLVNDVWGGDDLVEWKPVWEHDLDAGLCLMRQAIETHVITSHYALQLMTVQDRGLVVEITDGDEESNALFPDAYRGGFFYDLIKKSVIQLARTQAAELRSHHIAAVALTPGFLRSEAMLDHMGVTAEDWHSAVKSDPHFAHSESPAFIGRAVAALAADSNVMRWTGQSLATWTLAREYSFIDKDGGRPDWGLYFREALVPQLGNIIGSLS